MILPLFSHLFKQKNKSYIKSYIQPDETKCIESFVKHYHTNIQIKTIERRENKPTISGNAFHIQEGVHTTTHLTPFVVGTCGAQQV